MSEFGPIAPVSGTHFDENGVLVWDEEILDESRDDFGPQKVTLPTGNVTVCVVPRLARLLQVGHSRCLLVQDVWRHPDVGVEVLSEDETDYLYEWALQKFAETSQGLGFGNVCKLYGKMPSEYIGVEGRFASFGFDSAIAYHVNEAERKEMESSRNNADTGE